MNPRSVANSSGFPLQIRIGNVANSTDNWKVFLEEHPWQSNETNNEGFIDLVLEELNYSIQLMIVECKRVRQANWVFLIPQTKCSERSHICLWISGQMSFSDKKKIFGWQNCQGLKTYEAKFCAIPGQEHGRRNLIEHTASELIEATEAIACQEKQLIEEKSLTFDFRRIYVPVIVTTAELKIAFFDPDKISLSDGSLPQKTKFQTVPYVRFRKSFSSRTSNLSKAQPLKEKYGETERTVIVVNAEHFKAFLERWYLD